MLKTSSGDLSGDFNISNYKIIESLGQGGYSHIYKASDPDGNLVILKFPDTCLLGDLATYERFHREFEIGKKLRHPAIPRAIALIESPEVFIVLEYAEGKSLRNYIGKLTMEKVLSIAEQLAEVLDYFHTNGVYHRDLKPENIIIGTDGKIHIVDFGIALLEGTRRVTWRFGSNILGTPDYMSPEQIQGKRGDARTDIYAFGIILYEMATGTVPFSGENPLSIMNQHLTAVPMRPRDIQSDIPPGIEAIILKSIRRDPDNRYQSAKELIHDLKNYEDIDLSKFQMEKETTVQGVLTDRQIFHRTIFIFIAFLVVAAIIVIIAYLIRHGNI